MQIKINGENRDVPDNMTIKALVEHLQLPSDRLAVERNREVVSRTHWSSIVIEENDQLEVIHFVGGGQSSSGR